MNLSRRNLLLGAVQGAGLMMLSGCEKAFNSLQQNSKFLALLESAEGVNQRLQRLVTGKNKLAKEFTEQDISRYFKPNGNPPPITMDYAADAKNNGRHGDWKFWLGKAADSIFIGRTQVDAFANPNYPPRLRRRLERDCEMEGRSFNRNHAASATELGSEICRLSLHGHG